MSLSAVGTLLGVCGVVLVLVDGMADVVPALVPVDQRDCSRALKGADNLNLESAGHGKSGGKKRKSGATAPGAERGPEGGEGPR